MRSENFKYAVAKTLGFEGGYSNIPGDAGGETNLGITYVTLQRAIREGLIPNTTIAKLTREQAETIYHAYYWKPMQLDSIASREVAAELFDTCVNMGQKQAVIIAQEALSYLGEDINVDGMIGPNTINALNKWAQKDERALFVCLNGEQYIRYKLIRKVGQNYKFARGWTKRIQQYHEGGA